ncbi:MAG TPA: preprotein translocase subunit SecY, partial [Solirubrobacteraceae bacterium]|nr:preprotein translocase subunit SecY [Solirubrobacteraceae bacterium]
FVTYPKRQVGNKVYGGDSSHLPLKLNVSGVIPPIFASSILLIPATIAGFSAGGPGWLQWISTELSHGSPVYMLIYAAMIIFFSYFYTAVVFNPQETADNLKKYGGFIPGVRPGRPTAEFLDRILARLTFPGALFLAAIAALPTILISQTNANFFFGGTSILIVIGVALDTMKQLEAQLMMRNYEGFLK